MISPQKIVAASAILASLIEETRAALRGERDFGPVQVRALSELVSSMAPIMARAKELSSAHPQLATALEDYKKHLFELQTALSQVHVMLLARRAQMESARSQLNAVSRWANALSQTR